MKVFIEEQRFTQTWLLVVMGFSLLVPIYVIINEYLNENSEMTTNEFIGTIGGIILVTAIIFIFKLTTRIDEKGIHYKFFPFHWSFKIITWSEISMAFVRNYDPIGEYGGWGFKGGWSKSKGKALNVSGDVGIQLELKNGKKLLIGSQKENEAKSVLETYKSKIHSL
ncbi:MAG: hypothetical protein WAO74_09560 [Polaribacter sp.]|uniref:hypothetical protein n=1 Tax=Polaribacter sp. TaxID=1920175 RepID=UPI003BB17FB2